MKIRFLIIVFLMAIKSLSAQTYFTKNGTISFFSKTKIEDISAVNNQALCVLNSATGDLQFSVLIVGFHFPKAAMEEHFNENYLESKKYPKATFKGKIADVSKLTMSKDGTYNITVTGDLNIHNVTQKVTVAGTVIVKAGKVSVSSNFKIKLADYKVKIPGAVKDNIAEELAITVNCNLDSKK
jgi:uncharacterized protein with beta-barrel porin domain